jgi:hypothetical protein
MIHEIGVELQAKLKARGCPFQVEDGPEKTSPTTWGRERIVIAYDETGDRFGWARSQRANPPHRATCSMGCKITIYAQHRSSGALPFEHTRRARAVVDQVVVALYEIASARKNACTITGGRFFTPADLQESEIERGAAYELKFTFDRGVYERTWANAIRPTTTVTDGLITGTDEITIAGFEGTPETAC